MPTYRIDLAPTGRAGCTNKECKDNKVKITKGDVRVGSWVDTGNYQSFMWRHWGCVTPKMISNMIEAVGEGDDRDLDLLDGYEDLPQEHQEKLARALDQGHIDDDDWNGDLEMNRPGKHGFRVRVAKKKAAKAAEEEGEEKDEKEGEEGEEEKDEKEDDSHEEPKQTKKRIRRSRFAVEENEDEEKKPRPKRKPTGYPRYVPPASDEDEHDEDEEPVPSKAKAKATKRGKAKNEDDAPAAKRAKRAKKNDDEAEDEPVAEKPKRGRRKKST
ncbi:hypothetical protein BJY00DRAFT_278195 [Aspergillus carlsbadensis]|nr:hypothetical protein BJY00DRAFT_278195 [Aspergillus carlsbadensis]